MKHRCPKCGRENPHITRQCPLRESEPVCIECCKICEHFKDGYGCRYHAAEETEEELSQKAKERKNLRLELTKQRGYYNFLLKRGSSEDQIKTKAKIEAMEKRLREISR